MCQLIKNENISFVFVDDSYYGNLVKVIKKKCDAVAVVTFFHDVKAELFRIWMKGFKLARKLDNAITQKLIEENQELGKTLAENLQGALPAIALDGHLALSTAYMNDCEPLLCFAQQVNGYGIEGDVFLGISTSGNSKNILYAAVTAHVKGMKVIGLTGAKDSKLETLSDLCIKVPQTETYMIQELHLP